MQEQIHKPGLSYNHILPPAGKALPAGGIDRNLEATAVLFPSFLYIRT